MRPQAPSSRHRRHSIASARRTGGALLPFAICGWLALALAGSTPPALADGVTEPAVPQPRSCSTGAGAIGPAERAGLEAYVDGVVDAVRSDNRIPGIDVSGLPYVRYVEEHILRPLDMRHTTFREPLGPGSAASMPESLQEHLSIGHIPTLGGYRDGGFEYMQSIAPARAASSTAGDMSHLMVALLQSGRFGDTWIYDTETARLMWQRDFTDRTDMADFAHGFFNGEIPATRRSATAARPPSSSRASSSCPNCVSACS